MIQTKIKSFLLIFKPELYHWKLKWKHWFSPKNRLICIIIWNKILKFGYLLAALVCISNITSTQIFFYSNKLSSFRLSSSTHIISDCVTAAAAAVYHCRCPAHLFIVTLFIRCCAPRKTSWLHLNYHVHWIFPRFFRYTCACVS